MLRSKRPREGRPLPTLHIGSGRLEWLLEISIAEVLYAAVDLPDRTPDAIAAAAVEVAIKTGCEPQSCVLAIDSSELQQKALRLGELSKKDLRRTLLRKAANALDATTPEVLFSALPIERNEQEGDLRRWSLLAMKRQEVLLIREALCARGFPTPRVVASRFAPLALAESFLDDSMDGEVEATVVVGAELESVSISLLRGRGLVHQSILNGRFDAVPGMPAMLMQELRTLHGFWKKASSGGELTRVVIVGVHPDISEQMEPAINALFPGTDVLFGPATIDETPDCDRIHALRGCRLGGELQASLYFGLPPRRSTLAAVAAIVLVVAGVLGLIGRQHLQDELLTTRSGADALRSGVGDLAKLEEEQKRTLEALARLDQSREAIEGIERAGCDFERIVGDTFAALGERAALTSLAVEAGSRGTLRLSGVTDADPLASMRTLHAVVQDLEGCEAIEGVSLQPPNNVPETRDADNVEGLKFAIEARLDGGSE